MTNTERYIIQTDSGMYGMSPHRKIKGFRHPLYTYERDEAFTYASRATAEKWVHLFRNATVVAA